MKEKTIGIKENRFSIIKNVVFGSVADFFRTLGGKGTDDSDEIEDPALIEEVEEIAKTDLSGDVIEVEVGGDASFEKDSLAAYKRKVDPTKAVKANKARVEEKDESAKTRDAR